jgi:hypothetical protein
LIIVAPKILLRHPQARNSPPLLDANPRFQAACTLDDLGPGTHFHPVIDDPEVKNPADVRRVSI